MLSPDLRNMSTEVLIRVRVRVTLSPDLRNMSTEVLTCAVFCGVKVKGGITPTPKNSYSP